MRNWVLWFLAIVGVAPATLADAPTNRVLPQLLKEILWTGEKSMYNPALWSRGQTFTQRVLMLNTGGSQIYAVYLSSSDPQPLGWSIPPGASYRVCEPRQFSTEEPTAVVSANGKSDGFQERAAAYDAQCSWAQYVGAPDASVPTSLVIAHTTAERNQFFVVSDAKDISMVSDEDFARIFAVPLIPPPRPQPPPQSSATRAPQPLLPIHRDNTTERYRHFQLKPGAIEIAKNVMYSVVASLIAGAIFAVFRGRR